MSRINARPLWIHFFAKKVAALGKLQIVLRREQALNAVAEHRALADEKTSLPQHLLALPRALAWNMDRGNQLGLQKLGQHVGASTLSVFTCASAIMRIL